MWIALAGGGVSAIASLALTTGFPGGVLFVYLAPLPLLLVGLSVGASTAMVAGFVGITLTGLFAGVLSAGMFGMMNAFPAWLMVQQMLSKKIKADGSKEWETLGPAIAWLSVIGAIILAAGALAGGDNISTKAGVAAFLGETISVMGPNLTEDMRAALVEMLVPLFPGATSASWVLMLVVNTALAQKILRNGKRNLRPSALLANMKLPHWTSWALVGMATTALLSAGELEYISRNLTIVLATPFFFLGLAVVHYAAGYVTFPGSMLAFFYFVMFVLFGSGWSPMVVVGIGMFEQWAGLRIRFSGPRTIIGDD